MATTLHLTDHASRDDLRIYLERLDRFGKPEVRLVVRGSVLAVFGCTQAPEGITDPVPVVLALRAFALAEAPAREIDVVVSGRSLLDRLARMGLVGLTLELPEVEATAAWAGVLPPVGGWEPAGSIVPSSLADVAEAGIRRVAEALPDSPGDAVVRTVRREVWGSEIAPGLPAAAAFAASSLGFLSEKPVQVSVTLTWRRLATDRGEVLVRTLLG